MDLSGAKGGVVAMYDKSDVAIMMICMFIAGTLLTHAFTILLK